MTGPRPKLLAIDDERLLIEGLKKVLEKRGFDVRFALSGNEGLNSKARAFAEGASSTVYRSREASAAGSGVSPRPEWTGAFR